MPMGSAASLPGTPPQALLSSIAMARRDRRFPMVPRSDGAASPPSLLPLQKTAEDPPRGRILLAQPDATGALEVKRLLCGSGYRLIGPAASFQDAERMIDPDEAACRPPTCALLAVAFCGAASIADRLADRGVPFIWLADAAGTLPPVQSAAPVLRRPFDRRELLEAIENTIRRGADRRFYTTPPPQPVWPRIFPQL
jgi:hypothetical protein